MPRTIDAIILAVSTALILASCSSDGGSTDGSADSETHWESALNVCQSDGDCASGLSCLCGVCTKVCAPSSNDCSALGQSASCVAPSGGLPSRCSSAIPSAAGGLCLAPCRNDGECAQQGRDLTCAGAGYCVSNVDTSATDAGTHRDASTTPDAGLDASADTTDPNCHIDCFGGLACENGVVYQIDYGAMPCSVGDVCTRHQVGTCSNGCAAPGIDGIIDAGSGWDQICNSP